MWRNRRWQYGWFGALRLWPPSACELASNMDGVPLAGRTAVVTGSSRGIGRAIALRLAACGADVLVHGASQAEAARAVAGEIEALGRSTRVVMADLSEPAGLLDLVDGAWAWRKRIDIWVNNAGADVVSPAARQRSFAERLERLWQLDVRAAIELSRAVGERMKAAGSGVIVNIGWDGAALGMEGDTAQLYAAAKGAISAFTLSLAQTLAPEVRVNCIAPGWVRTDWARQASSYWKRRGADESLAGRWAEPDDIAGAVAAIVAPSAGFINGQIIAVNGGRRSSGAAPAARPPRSRRKPRKS